jgi:hypothetical protein
VNGALNMKELKFPWTNWHSMAAVIRDEILVPDDPLRGDPFWTERSAAEEMENTVVRPGIQRWTDARLERWTNGSDLTCLPDFFRQVVQTTTVNLVSSARESGTLSSGGAVNLPLTFFINSDILFDDFEIEVDIDPLSVDAAIYSEVLNRFDVACIDETAQFRFPGDSHLAFVVPEPAFEDNAVIRGLISAGVLSAKLAACLLMVDFCNPVFPLRAPHYCLTFQIKPRRTRRMHSRRRSSRMWRARRCLSPARNTNSCRTGRFLKRSGEASSGSGFLRSSPGYARSFPMPAGSPASSRSPSPAAVNSAGVRSPSSD